MSPVSDTCPEPLKSALEDMERIVQSKKDSILYAAPEMQNYHWGELQMQLAECLGELYTKLQMRVPCRACDASGKIQIAGDCPICKGSGVEILEEPDVTGS